MKVQLNSEFKVKPAKNGYPASASVDFSAGPLKVKFARLLPPRELREDANTDKMKYELACYLNSDDRKALIEELAPQLLSGAKAIGIDIDLKKVKDLIKKALPEADLDDTFKIDANVKMYYNGHLNSNFAAFGPDNEDLTDLVASGSQVAVEYIAIIKQTTVNDMQINRVDFKLSAVKVLELVKYDPDAAKAERAQAAEEAAEKSRKAKRDSLGNFDTGF